MISVGLDCSSTSTGYSVFEDNKLLDWGKIKPTGEDWRQRITNQTPIIQSLLERYNPSIVYVEDVPLKKGALQALVILGAVQGSLLGIMSTLNIPIKFVYPSEWRSPLGLYDGTKEGTKRAELKKKSIEIVNKKFGLDLIYKSPTSKYNDDDISDAILIAYSQIKSQKRPLGYK